MINKLKSIIEKILYVSKLTKVQNKKYRIALSVILSNLAVGMDVLIIVLFASVLNNDIIYQNEVIVDLINFMISNIFILPALVILRFLFLFVERLNIEDLGLKVGESLKNYLLKMSFEKGNMSSNDAYYFINQVSMHVSSFYRSVTIFINSLIQIAGYSLVLLLTDPTTFVYFAIGALVLIFPTKILLSKGKHYQHLAFEEGRVLNSYIQRVVDNVFLIKILSTMRYEFKKFGETVGNFNKYQINNIFYGSLNSILPTFGTLFILALLFTTNIVKQLSLEFIGVLLRLFQSLSSLNNGFNLLVNSSVHVDELYKLDKSSPTVTKSNYVLKKSQNNAVEFSNVNFKYLNADNPIFENLSLRIKDKSHTILTGPNGSGKSTIIGLISGLYIAKSGIVSVKSANKGYVGVTPLITQDTLRNNLLYGNGNNVEDKKILDLMEEFNFFASVDDGDLNKIIDNKSLSSGQLQKVSFIRSLLNDVEILLLDESTSNLDSDAKKLIFDILSKKNITIINSTHSKEDFNFHYEIKIEVDGNLRTVTY